MRRPSRGCRRTKGSRCERGDDLDLRGRLGSVDVKAEIVGPKVMKRGERRREIPRSGR